ncbi:MAG TPA: kelch repeat-containing protein [Anaeromyxobacteraceae bacterium]|nr:kelch repeat-containing protein [Anaeromyxobacteraceae bacterium]
MRACLAVLATLACGGALSSCGRMADGSYRPPTLATVNGTVHVATPPSVPGRILLALTWQSSARTREFFVELPPVPPWPGDAPPTCTPLGPLSQPCEGTPWSGAELCRVRDDVLVGLTRPVAFEPVFPASFILPIDDLPPTAARYELDRQGGRGTLALAHLVAFVDEDGDGQIRFGNPERPPETAIANSAFQGCQPEPGTSRVSYYVAFLNGEIADGGPPTIAPGYHAIRDLPLGFSIWKKTEAVDASGRVLAVEYSVEPIDSPVELFDFPGVEGLSVWCAERDVEKVWVPSLPPDGAPFRCSAGMNAVSCIRTTTTAPCSHLEEKYQFDSACVWPPPISCTGWWVTYPLTVAAYSSVLLQSGKVLSVGTDFPNGGEPVKGRIFDPATGGSWPTGSTAALHDYATFTVLASGKVLAAGGNTDSPGNNRSAEIYDPETGIWSATGSMTTARALHTATLLPSGEVLVVGGISVDAPNGLDTAELYDPEAGTWSAATPVSTPRYYHAALLLDSGLVLVTGGGGGNPVELYDPATGSWRSTGDMPIGHQYGTFTLLPSGRVLALGGVWGDTPAGSTAAEIYDPKTESWSLAAPMPRARWNHGAAVLPSGRVLVVGGEQWDDGRKISVAEVDIYDPATDSWSSAHSLNDGFSVSAAISLPTGMVLVVGGVYSCVPIPGPWLCAYLLVPSVELYCEPPAAGTTAAVQAGHRVTGGAAP